MIRLHLPLLALLAAGAASCGEEETSSIDPGDFLRFETHEDRSATLETAITSYVDGEGRRVDLVGAVHVADRDYFELLNRIFKGYDAVLYELVKDKDTPVVRRPGDKESLIGTIQRAMKDLLGVEFQLDVIDYGVDNFVHADLEPGEFFRMQEERGESIFTLMLQVMIKEWEVATDHPESQVAPYAMLLAMMSKDRARGLKMILGRQFSDLERIAAGFEKGLHGEESVLLVERNKAALRVLREQLDAGKQRVAIFYGAAHLPDMERRLIGDFGFQRSGENWLAAWSIEAPEQTGEAPTKAEDEPPSR